MNTFVLFETILETRTEHCSNVMEFLTVSDARLSTILHDSRRQSCSHLPISNRKDRFKDPYEYSQIYSYNGLNDIQHYLSIKRLLRTLNRWDFNIFALERFSSGSPLTYLSVNLFEVHDLISHFQLDISKLYKFFITMERSYHSSNPYHNALHAADVTQAINFIIQDKKIWSQLTKKDILCSLLSTICHDVDHPGVNNMFMNNSQHHLSVLYKKDSVLENHHWAFSLSVLKETNLFSNFEPSMWKSVTNTCRSLIRATDISKQNTYLNDFNKSLLSVYPNQNDALNDAEKLLVLQMAIKCADICNPCRRWDICNCWAYLVTEEFFQQGDKEKAMALPVSSIMDRERTRLPVVQKDFINYLVLPLFRVWDQFINSASSKTFLENIDSNLTKWQLLVNQSTLESDNIILNSTQILYDRMQLMQVMDYSRDYQLSHLQRLRLLIDANYIEEVCQSQEESAEMDENQNIEALSRYPLSDMIEEGETQIYQQYRRGSLPITLILGNNSKKYTVTNRQKLKQRKTSLQSGQCFMTSLSMMSMAKNRNSSLHFVQYGELAKFPTSCRRKSAPAIKANPVAIFDTISIGRRGSLTSYFCSPKLSSGICSSQSQLYQHHANSMNDIQIPQVG